MIDTARMRAVVPVLAVVVVAALPFLVADRFLLKVFTFVGINVLVVTGLALLFGYAGQVSLGNAAFVGIGAYACAFLTTKAHVPWVVAFLAAGAISALGGLLLALPSLRLRGHYLAMATLGFGELMSLAFAEAVPITGGVDGFTGIPFPTLGEHRDQDPRGPVLAHLGGRRLRSARCGEHGLAATRACHARVARQ